MSDEQRKPERVITIEVFGGNDYTIREGEHYCDRLCWDEMLGTVAELTHPQIGKARYRMLTAPEHAEVNARLYRRSGSEDVVE